MRLISNRFRSTSRFLGRSRAPACPVSCSLNGSSGGEGETEERRMGKGIGIRGHPDTVGAPCGFTKRDVRASPEHYFLYALFEGAARSPSTPFWRNDFAATFDRREPFT